MVVSEIVYKEKYENLKAKYKALKVKYQKNDEEDRYESYVSSVKAHQPTEEEDWEPTVHKPKKINPRPIKEKTGRNTKKPKIVKPPVQ